MEKLVGAGWTLAGALAALTALRLTRQDERCAVAVAASTGTPLVLAAAWPVLAVGLAASPALAAVGAGLAAGHLASLRPLFAGPPRRAGTPVRLLALNVLYTEDVGAAVTAQVAATGADVVVLTEVTMTTLRHLDLADHPHVLVDAHPLARGSAVFSRYPFHEARVRDVAGIPMSGALLDLPDGKRLQVQQVHTSAPMGRRHTRAWRAQLAELVLETREGGVPTVWAGDFNASRWNRPFADLLGGPRQIRDATDGIGPVRTWPAGKLLLPPLLHLDHVLVDAQVGVTAARVLPGVGSDHLAVLVDLTV